MSRFIIRDIEENNKIYYCVHDNLTGNDIHCEKGKLTETILGLLEKQDVSNEKRMDRAGRTYYGINHLFRKGVISNGKGQADTM